MAEQPLFDFRKFRGIDNVSDPAKIAGSSRGTFLVLGNNCDVDDEGMLKLRDGRGAAVFSGDIHSLWANETETLCFFVLGGSLYRLKADYSATIVRTGLNRTARVYYVEVNGNVYYTNSTVIGFVDGAGVDHALPDPGQEFKVRLIPGNLIEFFNGRLYVGNDEGIFFSDAMAFTCMDIRKNFIGLAGRKTMIKAVTDGLYVSYGKKTCFIAGRDPAEFVLSPISDSAAFEQTAVTVDGEDIGKDNLGRVVLWTSPEGVFLGGPGGQCRNLTWDHYVPPETAGRGSGIYRTDPGFGQYLVFIEP